MGRFGLSRRAFAGTAGRVLKCLLPAFFCINSLHAVADCSPELPLKGTESVPDCDPAQLNCVPAERALHAYMEKISDGGSSLPIGVHASPWRFYDPDYRIVTVEELADRVRPALSKGAKRVVLYVSWSSVRPGKGTRSLAERLSEALGGFPVQGFDGFLWLRADGKTRTTRQAKIIRSGGAYQVQEGDEIMASMVAGYPLYFTDKLVASGNGAMINIVAAAWDILGLCPDNALNYFDKAAEAGYPIGAYNAALMRIERGKADDLATAERLLRKASDSGDDKARSRLATLMAAQARPAVQVPAVQAPSTPRPQVPSPPQNSPPRPETDTRSCLNEPDNFAVMRCIENIEKARRRVPSKAAPAG